MQTLVVHGQDELTHPVGGAGAPDDELAGLLDGDGHVHAVVQEVLGPHPEVVVACC